MLARAFLIAVTLAPSLVYVFTGYVQLSQMAAEDSRVQAIRTAHAIADNPQIWQFASDRLADQIEEVRHEGTQTTLTDLAGKAILTIGKECTGFCLAGRAPLLDFGHVAGELRVTIDMAPLLVKGAGIGIIGIAIGVLLLHFLNSTLAARRRSEDVIAREGIRLHTILEMASDGIHVVDSDGLLVEANKAFLNTLGYDKAAIGRLHAIDWSADEPWEVIKARNDDLIARHGTALYEIAVRCRDGTRRDMEINASGIEIEGKGYLYAAFRDITARKQADEALRQSEMRNRKLMDASPDGIWVHNEGRIHYANNALARMLGYSSPDEIVGRTIYEFFPPEQLTTLHSRVEAISAKSTLATAQMERLRRDGTVIPVEVAVASYVQDGIPWNIAIARDITERKHAEAERARLESQLRESQKMEALGTLAGGVAHDFNNALATIMGNVALARQDVGPGHAAQESLEEIVKAGRRAKDLVQQILAFGRRQTLERKPTSLALVVVETARLMRASLPAKVNLRVNCNADTPAVLADATQIKQVLINLCGNALQAVQDLERPGLIEVMLDLHTQGETHGRMRPGRYACLTVRDNGSGMDEATRSHIFEPFFTTKPRGKGTGLGLSVVHGIAQAHEASIEVESSPGEGSTFRIYFPATEESVAQVAEIDAATPPLDGKGKRVLYVDDEAAIVSLMKRLLERQGFRVSGYPDPREALAVLRAHPDRFDLVVTDFNMPGMSGLEVAQEIQAIRADLPVVLASGYITEDLRQKAPAAGIRELIYKPDTADDLCEAVARYANAQVKAE